MSLGLSLDWLANLFPGERLLLAALGSPGAVPALSSHFVRAAGLLTLSGALLHLRRSHQHAALQHQQELALRQELLAYLAFAGSSRPLRASEDAFQNASDLGRQLSRLIARRSSFGRTALLLRGAGNLLTVAGSAGFDDLSVEALNRWGRSVSGPSLGPELALAGSAVGPSPITSSSFTLRLDRRRTERSPLSSMSCRDVHIVPLSTAQGLLGALVVSTQTRPVSHFGPVCPQDPEPSWPLEVTASLPLADRLQPLQVLALRLARPETLTADCPFVAR